MAIRIVLISCVKTKLPVPARARDLYKSTLFKHCLKYAEQIEPDSVYVLSAEYGLVPLDRIIAPYEKTLNKIPIRERKEWAKKVLRQLESVCSLDETEFIFLAGIKYREFLLPWMPRHTIPLEGIGLFGQVSKLKELIE